MSNEILLQDCLTYFSSKPGFLRPLLKIREKFRSLGTLGGTIQITNLTNEEKEALTGFLKRDCFKKNLTFKVESFIRAFEHTKYNGIDFSIFLNLFFNENIISKKEEKSKFEEEQLSFFNELIHQFDNTLACNWLIYVRDLKDNAYRIINQKYIEDKAYLYSVLVNVCRAVNMLSFNSKNIIRLAVLSSLVTKNPHYFDDETFQNKLLLYAIVNYLAIPYPENAEQITELLYKAGIIKDEVSNFTLCSGLLAFDEKGSHPGWEGFLNRAEPLQVSLLYLSKLKGIRSPFNKIFVFENPTVFTEVYERTKEFKPPIMCTFGNLKVSSLILLDYLAESGTTIYYSGDFDPEGLLIVDKLISRYSEQLVLWGYNKENYLNNLSNEIITENRLNKLNKIKGANLQEIVSLVKEHKLATYQELLIDFYVYDLRTTSVKNHPSKW